MVRSKADLMIQTEEVEKLINEQSPRLRILCSWYRQGIKKFENEQRLGQAT